MGIGNKAIEPNIPAEGQPPSYISATDDKLVSPNSRKIELEAPLVGEDKGGAGAYKISIKVLPIKNGGTGASNQQEAANAILDYPNLIDGSILYHVNNCWLPLPPGNDGQSLGIVKGKPVWSSAVVSIPKTASVITLEDESKSLPNSAKLKGADGITHENGQLGVDDTVLRTNKPQVVEESMFFKKLGAETLKLTAKLHSMIIKCADVSKKEKLPFLMLMANLLCLMVIKKLMARRLLRI